MPEQLRNQKCQTAIFEDMDAALASNDAAGWNEESTLGIRLSRKQI